MLINLQPKAMMVSTDGSESSKEAFYVKHLKFPLYSLIFHSKHSSL